jgi:hypothetical protein
LIEAGAGPDGFEAAGAAAAGDATGDAAGDATAAGDAAGDAAGEATGEAAAAGDAAGDAGAAAGAAGFAVSAGLAVGLGAADGPHASRRTAIAVTTGTKRLRDSAAADRIMVVPSQLLVIPHWSTGPAAPADDGRASGLGEARAATTPRTVRY